ncbi:MAG: hypothetical protein JKY45_13300 [Emcibacter sp.]|nr:hypothetical protein [Emcibacter sp.]
MDTIGFALDKIFSISSSNRDATGCLNGYVFGLLVQKQLASFQEYLVANFQLLLGEYRYALLQIMQLARQYQRRRRVMEE